MTCKAACRRCRRGTCRWGQGAPRACLQPQRTDANPARQSRARGAVCRHDGFPTMQPPTQPRNCSPGQHGAEQVHITSRRGSALLAAKGAVGALEVLQPAPGRVGIRQDCASPLLLRWRRFAPACRPGLHPRALQRRHSRLGQQGVSSGPQRRQLFSGGCRCYC